MDADDFLNFLFDGGGGGGGLLSDALANSLPLQSGLSSSSAAVETLTATSNPIHSSDASMMTMMMSSTKDGLLGGKDHSSPFMASSTLDTPVFESLTEDFFAGLLSSAGADGALETIDPDQLLSHCDTSSSPDDLFQSAGCGGVESRFSYDNDSSNDFSPDHTPTYARDLTPEPISATGGGAVSPRSPPDHTYAGSDDGGRSLNSPHSPSNSDASIMDQDAEMIFTPYLEGVGGGDDDSSDETDSNVEIIGRGGDQIHHSYTSVYTDAAGRYLGGGGGGGNEVYVLEDDLAATEVVLTSVDDFSNTSSPSHKTPIFVKIVNPHGSSSTTPAHNETHPDDYQLDASQVTANLPIAKNGTAKQQQSRQHTRPSHAAKRSFITVKTRPQGRGGGSTSSGSSTHSSVASEELNFGVGEKKPVVTQNYSRKTQPPQRHYTRKSEAASARPGGGVGGDSKFPKLELTEEERRLLHQEGVSLPERLPLTKQEERALKSVRRKIRNKQSALASRQKKKTYVDNLESRVKMCSDENQRLLGRVATLEAQNGGLLTQLKRLQAAMQNANKPVHASTCVMVLLLSFALLLFPNLSPLENNLPDEFKELLQRGAEDKSLETSGGGKSAIIVPGQSRNLLSATSGAADRAVDIDSVVKIVENNFDVATPSAKGVDLKVGKKRSLHDSLMELGSAGYIIDDDIDDELQAAPPEKRQRVESVVQGPSVNETRTNAFVNDDDDNKLVDVKPDVETLDFVIRNNAKNLGVKTYENAYESIRVGRKILTTETNIIDI